MNLTAGFTYGRGRLRDMALTIRANFEERKHSRIAIRVLSPDRQTSIFLDTVATKRKLPAGNKLPVVRSGSSGSILVKLTSEAILEPARPPDEGR